MQGRFLATDEYLKSTLKPFLALSNIFLLKPRAQFCDKMFVLTLLPFVIELCLCFIQIMTVENDKYQNSKSCSSHDFDHNAEIPAAALTLKNFCFPTMNSETDSGLWTVTLISVGDRMPTPESSLSPYPCHTVSVRSHNSHHSTCHNTAHCITRSPPTQSPAIIFTNSVCLCLIMHPAVYLIKTKMISNCLLYHGLTSRHDKIILLSKAGSKIFSGNMCSEINISTFCSEHIYQMSIFTSATKHVHHQVHVHSASLLLGFPQAVERNEGLSVGLVHVTVPIRDLDLVRAVASIMTADGFDQMHTNTKGQGLIRVDRSVTIDQLDWLSKISDSRPRTCYAQSSQRHIASDPANSKQDSALVVDIYASHLHMIGCTNVNKNNYCDSYTSNTSCEVHICWMIIFCGLGLPLSYLESHRCVAVSACQITNHTSAVSGLNLPLGHLSQTVINKCQTSVSHQCHNIFIRQFTPNFISRLINIYITKTRIVLKNSQQLCQLLRYDTANDILPFGVQRPENQKLWHTGSEHGYWNSITRCSHVPMLAVMRSLMLGPWPPESDQYQLIISAFMQNLCLVTNNNTTITHVLCSLNVNVCCYCTSSPSSNKRKINICWTSSSSLRLQSLRPRVTGHNHRVTYSHIRTPWSKSLGRRVVAVAVVVITVIRVVDDNHNRVQIVFVNSLARITLCHYGIVNFTILNQNRVGPFETKHSIQIHLQVVGNNYIFSNRYKQNCLSPLTFNKSPLFKPLRINYRVRMKEDSNIAMICYQTSINPCLRSETMRRNYSHIHILHLNSESFFSFLPSPLGGIPVVLRPSGLDSTFSSNRSTKRYSVCLSVPLTSDPTFSSNRSTNLYPICLFVCLDVLNSSISSVRSARLHPVSPSVCISVKHYTPAEYILCLTLYSVCISVKHYTPAEYILCLIFLISPNVMFSCHVVTLTAQRLIGSAGHLAVTQVTLIKLVQSLTDTLSHALDQTPPSVQNVAVVVTTAVAALGLAVSDLSPGTLSLASPLNNDGVNQVILALGCEVMQLSHGTGLKLLQVDSPPVKRSDGVISICQSSGNLDFALVDLVRVTLHHLELIQKVLHPAQQSDPPPGISQPLGVPQLGDLTDLALPQPPQTSKQSHSPEQVFLSLSSQSSTSLSRKCQSPQMPYQDQNISSWAPPALNKIISRHHHYHLIFIIYRETNQVKLSLIGHVKPYHSGFNVLKNVRRCVVFSAP